MMMMMMMITEAAHVVRDGIKRNANWVVGRAERRRVGTPTRCRENDSQMDL
jgi:hypothetical protein